MHQSDQYWAVNLYSANKEKNAMIYGVPSFHWWNPAPGASSCKKSSSDRRSNVSELTGLGLPMANCSNEEAAESMAKVVLSPNRVPESTQEW